MNILLLGSGGREHALAQKIAASPHCKQLFIAPGNGGTAQHGTNINIDINDFDAIENFVLDNEIAMIVVGPEEPLVKGVYDFFAECSIPVIGPSASGARLEGSKKFSKRFMHRNGIPTAAYHAFTPETYDEGIEYIAAQHLPIVLKADGLAAGKGVVICNTHQHAEEVFADMLLKNQFGEAGSTVVVEQFLSGIELSVFVLTDGFDYKIIGHAKDYKRIGEGDTGPNTGGMGCVSPVPFADDAFMKKVEETIIKPTIKGLGDEKLDYRGFIFFGLINVSGEPYVIEYNCRMGDPETEVVLPRLKNDLVDLFLKVQNNQLDEAVIEFDDRAAATVMAVSKGYPGTYEKGKPISLPTNLPEDTMLFHAGTNVGENGELLTNGGRVIAATAMGANIIEAATTATALIEQVQFEGRTFRKDIGYEFA